MWRARLYAGRCPAGPVLALLLLLPLTGWAMGTAPGDSSPEEAREEEETTADTPPVSDSEKAGSGLRSILEGASGVRVATMCTNCNIAGVTMCGQTGDHVQVRADGLPVVGGLGGIYLLSVIPSEGIARSEVVRGAGTVQTGNEAGVGAIVMETKEPGREPRMFATLDAGTFGWRSGKLLVLTKRDRWGAGLTVTRAKSQAIDPDDDGNYELGSFHRRTVAGDLSFDLGMSSRLRIGAQHYGEEQRDAKGAYNHFHEIGQGRKFQREDVDIERQEYYLGFEQDFTDGSRLSLSGRHTKRNQETTDDSVSYYSAQPYMVVDEEATLGELRYERTLFNLHMFTGGLVYQDLQVSGSIWSDPYQEIHDVIDQRGAYAEFLFSLPHRLDLTTGVRYDDLGQFGSRASPRTRLAWKATTELGLTLSAGYGFMAPRPILERICCGAWVQSNSNVEAEISRNLLLDVDYVPWPWLRFRASLFRNDFENYIEKFAVWSFPSFHPSFQQVNYDDVRMEGGELFAEVRLGNFIGAVQGTRLSTWSEEPLVVFPFSDVPPSSIYYRFRHLNFEIPEQRIPHHPRDQASVSLGWDDTRRGFSLNAEGQYTGSMLIQEQMETGFGPVIDFWETPSKWVYNFRFRVRVHRNLSLFGGMDNITDEFEDRLDDPRYEYNWGPLRGRYVYGGLSIEL